ncbi:MAG: isopeptide-forming domain-containing fimbrial protein [Coriobacteriia bacterium]|nr:isopeptide-forming domain-containing fimbrial protein [Coriobacteriia bacterium]
MNRARRSPIAPVSRLARFALAWVIATSSVVMPVLTPAPVAVAAPSVALSASVPDALLGDQVTVRVTVTNDTSDTAITAKGYNLDIAASFDSSLTSPNGQVTFVSASDGSGAQVPVGNVLDPVTGIRSLTFTNLKDLAYGESYSLNLVLDTAGDPTWEVGQKILGAFSATLYQSPTGVGPVVGAAAASGTLVPLSLTKSANQSTALDQASGTQTRTFTHTVVVQNNYVRPTASVVMTDVVPDGIEYLGMVSGPAPDAGFPTTNTVTGEKTLRWTLGTFAPGQNTTIVYQTGIRYDWYGTANGGTNRPHDSALVPTGTAIPNHTQLQNRVDLDARYRGTLPATISVVASDTAQVRSAYVTLAKTGGPGTVGYSDEVTFDLTLYASQYYSSDGIEIRDTLPDGLTFTTATVAPSTVTTFADGTTLLTWLPSVVGTLAASTDYTIQVKATVDKTWQGAGGPAGEPIRANDGFTNRVEFDGTWHDEYYPARTLAETIINEASVPMGTGLPEIAKDVYDPAAGTWSKATSATVGDVLTFRVRFNTDDGATALRDDITMGYTEVTDWLPPGLAFNNDAAITRSPDTSFSVPSTGTPRPLNLDSPDLVTLAGLDGVQWFLGDVGEDAWWEATFSATVTDTVGVQDGVVDTNYWKLTGLDTSGQTYSKRDANTISYQLPDLTLTKTAPAAPAFLLPGVPAAYTISVTNTALEAARDVAIVDTLPVGMRETSPTVTSVLRGGVPLVQGVDYKVAPYDPVTGVLAFDFFDTAAPAVDTSLPGGSNFVITYSAAVDQGVGAGTSLTNTASVSYSTQNVGGRRVELTGNPADLNTDVSTKQVQLVTIVKGIEPPGNRTVGDTISYNMTMTVPPGTRAYWPSLRDVFTRDGVQYVPLSSTLVTVSGNPPSPASFVTLPEPAIITTAGTPSTRLDWNLNTIDNSGTATPYVFALKFQVVYTGRLDNGNAEMVIANTGSTDNNLSNTGSVRWNTVDAGPGATNQTASTALLNVSIRQPRLINSKAVISPGPYTGGMPISYETTFTNTGTWPAYNVSWQDLLPSQLGTATLTFVRHSTVGTLTAGVDYTANFSSLPTLTISFEPSVTVGAGQNIAVRYVTSVIPTAGAGAQLTNTSDVDWYSRVTTASPTRVYNDQPSTAQGENVTNDTRTVTIPIQSVSAVKSIDSTPNPTIGDEVTYRVRVTVPTETIMYQNPYILDSIATTGLAYVAGSATLTDVSGSAVTSAAISSVVTSSAGAPGGTVRFNLGPIVSNASVLSPEGDSAYVFDIVFRMRVTGRLNSGVETWAPTAAVSSLDTITATWFDQASGGTSRSSAASTRTVSIVQPRLVTTKSFSAAVVPAAGVVTATVTVTNSGLSTAYPLVAAPSLVDALPFQLIDPVMVSATKNPGAIPLIEGVDFSTAYAGGQLRLTYLTAAMEMAPGDSITYVYTCDLNPLAGAGSIATNTADADWSSLPGDQPDERIYDDTNEPLEGTQDTAVSSVNVPGATVSKGLVSLPTTYTIGDTVTYDVTVTIPPGTTAYSAVVTDTAVDGLSITGATVPFGAVGVGPKTGAGTVITWALGDVSNAPSATATMRVTARVDDTRSVGGPPVAGQTLTNTALLGWYDAPVAGVLRTSTQAVNVTVVEPRLSIVKAANVTTVAAGGLIDYTLTMANSGTAPAFGPRVLDRLPDELFSASSPVLLDVTLDSVPVAGADYTADLTTSPTLTVDFDPAWSVPVGSTLRIRYRATAEPGVTAGLVLVNRASLTEYSTQPGTPYERVYAPQAAQATVTVQAPALVTAKTVLGDATPQRGGTVNYRFTVRNVGSAPAYAVEATDTLPAGFEYVAGSTSAAWPSGSSTADPGGGTGPALSWPLGAVLAPGETLTLTYDALVTPGAPTGTATNTAGAVGVDGGGAAIAASTTIPADTDADDRSQATVLVTDPKVTVTKALAVGQLNPVRPGDPVTFTINVANTGDTTLTTVPLVDTFDEATLSFVSASLTPSATIPLGTLTWNDITGSGSLAPGVSTTITVRFNALASSPSSVDTATVSGAVDVNGDSPPTATSNADIAIRRIAVAVNKVLSSGSAAVLVGSPVSYDIGVTNTGDTTLTTVPLSDTFDTRLGFVSATPAQTSISTPTVSWANLGSLGPGVTTTVTVTFTVLATGTAITDTARVAGATDGTYTAPTAEATNSVLTGIAPHLVVTKASSVTTAEAGQVVTYTATIHNDGTAPAYDVHWYDTMDLALVNLLWPSPMPVSVYRDSTLLIHTVDFWAIFMGIQSPSVDFTDPLPVGSTFTITYTARVNGGVTQGQTLSNTTYADYASQTGLPYTSNNADVTVTAVSPALVTNKTVSDTHVQRGEAVTWTYAVTNVGGGSARSVNLSDTLPADFAYVPGSTSITWPSGSNSADPAISGQDLAWGSGATLAPGETLTLTFDSTVTAGAPLGTAVNTAQATAVDGAGSTVPADASVWLPADTDPDDTDTAQVRVTEPDVGVLKTVVTGQDTAVQVGEAVSFDIRITNTGDTTITTVPLHDSYDATRLTFVSATPTEDASSTGSLSWNNIGPLDPSAWVTVTVHFTARATGAALNSAEASGTDEFNDPVPPDSDSDGVRVTHPAITIDKIRTSAASLPVGGAATYDLVIRNSGDTTVTTLPLFDTFDSTHLAYVTASQLPDTVGAARLDWTDVTGAGGLAPSATTTVSVTFQVTAPGSAITNSAEASGTDEFSDPVPPVTDTDSTLTGTRPILSIDKIASRATAPAGATVTYTVTIENSGDSAAHDIAFQDTVDAALHTAPTSPRLIGAAIDAVPLPPASYTAVFGAGPVSTLTLGAAAPLAAGSTLTLVYEATVAGGVRSNQTLDNTATVTSYTSMPGVVAGEGVYGPLFDTARVTALSPALIVDKTVTGDTHPQRTGTTSWRFTVTNVGDAAASSLTVTDTLPAGFSFVAGTASATWPTGSTSADPAVAGQTLTFATGATLQPGQTLTLDFTSLVGAATPLGTAVNTAQATAVDGGSSPVPADASVWLAADTDADDTDTAQVRVTNPHVSVTKALSAGQDPVIQAGQTVRFDVVVTNSGDTTLTQVPLTETFDATRLEFVAVTAPSGAAGGALQASSYTFANVGQMAPGATATFTFTFRARGATGVAVDTVTVSGARDEFADPVPTATATANVLITAPSIAVAKTLSAGSPNPVRLGENVSFDIRVTNTGDTTVTTLPLTDLVDAGLRYVSATVPPTSVTASSSGGTDLAWADITSALGDIAPGRSVTLSVTFATERAGTSLGDRAVAGPGTDVNGDPIPSDDARAEVGVYDVRSLVWAKRAESPGGTIMLPGQQITYYLEVTNNTGVEVPGLSLVDTLSPMADFNSGSLAISMNGGTYSPLTDAASDDAGEYSPATRVLTARFAPVAAGATASVRFSVTVGPEEISRAGVLNTASLLAGGALASESGPVYHPVDPIAIEKTGTDLNGGSLEAGDKILWTIVVGNTGLVQTTDVVVTDDVPAQTTFLSGSMTGRGAVESAAPRLRWNVGVLQVGESAQLTFISTVNAGLANGTKIRNQATVTSDQSLPKSSDDPMTSSADDPTLLQTGDDERWTLGLSLMALVAGAVLILAGRGGRGSRRRRRLA